MENDASEKKHLPTGRRLADLRKQGTVLRSRDFSAGLIFVAMIMMLIFMSGEIVARFQADYISAFTSIKRLVVEPQFLPGFIMKMALDNLFLLLPLFLAVLVATLAVPFLFGGWNFSLEATEFKFSKMNPISNLKRIFSPVQAALEITRSFFKSMFILSCLIYFMMSKKDEIELLINLPLQQAVVTGYVLIKQFIILLIMALVVLVGIDMFYQKWQFMKQAKMSTQEIKDESKDMEGSPEAKRKIRSKQIAMARQRMTIAVPRANVIITNPTHYAIALKYDDGKDRAPRVVAKGKDLVAQQIRQLAISNGVPIYEAPSLARAIYFTTKVNMEIHPELYMAVAIVLSYVHQLKNYQMGRGKAPNFVSEFDLPKEFIYQE